MNIFSRRSSGEVPDGDGDNLMANDEDNRSGSGSPVRRRVIWACLALLVVVVAFVSWLGVNAFDAKSNLEQARDSAQQAKDALLQGDSEGASKLAADAASHAQAARDATHSLPWSVAAGVPWLGSPFETGQQISNVVLGLATDVLQPSAQSASVLAPDQLLADGRLNVKSLSDQEPQLSKIAASAVRLDQEARLISDPRYLSVLGSARSELQQQTADVANLLENTTLAARLAPSLMGLDGPRTYFMGFQTPAEARGTGGLLGGFGILRFDNGVPTVEELGPNTDLTKDFAPVDLGPEFQKNYGTGDPFKDFRNSNQSSHFPYAAQIWKSMWQQQAGMTVDGVIALDPVALSYILGAVGPVTMPDGEIITKDNVVELTLSTAYMRFPEDQAARKEYLQGIATEVVNKLTGPIANPRALLDALGKGVSEQRIAMWSSSPADQELLEQTPLANVILDDPAPYAEVVVNNLGGNKMDYYLKRDIEYVADGCDGDTRNSTVTVGLSNTVQDVPDANYIAGTLGFTREKTLNVPRGTMFTSVRLLATTGAELVSVLSNGLRVPVFTTTERNHPSFEVQLAIPPGQSAEVIFRLAEPTAPGEARVPTQPLVDTVTPVVSVPACSG